MESEKVSNDVSEIFRTWFRARFFEYLKVLFCLLVEEDIPQSLQTLALDSIMDFVRFENVGIFNNSIFFDFCTTLVNAREISDSLISKFLETYFQYWDVRHFTYSNLQKLIEKKTNLVESGKGQIPKNDKSKNGREGEESSVHSFARTVYLLLSSLPPPPPEAKGEGEKQTKRLILELMGGGEKESTPQYWSIIPEKKETEKLLTERPKKRQKKDDEKNKKKEGKDKKESTEESKWGIKRQKKKFQDCWISFLQMDLPLDIYKKVLVKMEKDLIPNMPNPLLLSDFLTDSYNQGGVTSVMALNGLFVLITMYGLEYPLYYQRLYSLFEPSIYFAKYRARFFELLDASLNSSHLPSYLASSFAKKIARSSLSSPPSGCLVAIAFIHNLLRRHPTINVLVHRPTLEKTKKTDESEEDEDTVNNVDSEEEGEGEEEGGREEGEEGEDSQQGKREEIGGGEKLGKDPYDPLEPDLAKCKALESSLWEIETLRNHYCPAVSRFVSSLETDLTQRAKTSEVSISDFSGGSYSTILSEEVGKRLKKVPLAFYQNTPTSLFSKERSGFEEEEKIEKKIEEFDDFSGWTFSKSKKK